MPKKRTNNTQKKNNSTYADQELKSSLDIAKTKTDHLAVFIIDILGSMQFLVLCIFIFTAWICWNLNLIYFLKPFDPFPFPILEMLVSLFAIILSVSVLINQNRQGRIEKIRQQVEFEVNVRAEGEITKILNIIHEIHQQLGLKRKDDKELEEMKENIDIKQLHHTIDEKETKHESLLKKLTIDPDGSEGTERD